MKGLYIAIALISCLFFSCKKDKYPQRLELKASILEEYQSDQVSLEIKGDSIIIFFTHQYEPDVLPIAFEIANGEKIRLLESIHTIKDNVVYLDIEFDKRVASHDMPITTTHLIDVFINDFHYQLFIEVIR